MARSDDAVELELAGRPVRLSRPDKVMIPRTGTTKRGIVAFYEAIAEPLARAVGGRPVLLERFPDGVKGKSFFQKRVPANAPDWLTTHRVATVNGTPSDALVLVDLAHVAWAVNLGCLGFHVWPFLVADDPEPGVSAPADELRIDLDPSPGTNFDDVRAAAAATRTLLDELGIRSWPKTTGSRGVHVHVRVPAGLDSYQVRAAAVALARELERRHPDTITAAWWKEERGARVFVDFNQNAPHKTVFGAWSIRARVGGQVSTPFAWDELDELRPDELTVETVPDRVAAEGDPWTGIDTDLSTLAPLLELWDADMAAGMMDAPWPPVYPKQPNEPPRVAPSRAADRDEETR